MGDPRIRRADADDPQAFLRAGHARRMMAIDRLPRIASLAPMRVHVALSHLNGASRGFDSRRHYHERRHGTHGHATSTWSARSTRFARKAALRSPTVARIMPDPILVGRNAAKLAGAGRRRTAFDAGRRISTPRSPTRTTPSISIRRRPACAPELIRKAIAAGKHIYTEKPVAPTVADALDLYRRAQVGRRQARRRAGQAVAARPAQAEDADRFRASSAASCRCAASSATGCSRATGSRRSGRRGTTARRTTAASSSTCCATGATCSTICSAT